MSLAQDGARYGWKADLLQPFNDSSSSLMTAKFRSSVCTHGNWLQPHTGVARSFGISSGQPRCQEEQAAGVRRPFSCSTSHPRSRRKSLPSTSSVLMNSCSHCSNTRSLKADTPQERTNARSFSA
jgi:hypothetical protein